MNKNLLNDVSVKKSIVQGFRWICRERPIRNIKFKIIYANLPDFPIYCGGGQIIPIARGMAYSSFLPSSPRLLKLSTRSKSKLLQT